MGKLIDFQRENKPEGVVEGVNVRVKDVETERQVTEAKQMFLDLFGPDEIAEMKRDLDRMDDEQC